MNESALILSAFENLTKSRFCLTYARKSLRWLYGDCTALEKTLKVAL